MSGETGYTILMPKLGLTMTEAKLVKWYKEEGARVEKGETLFTLESEKSVLEIESPASGFLHILVPAGQIVPVKTPIAVLLPQPSAGPAPAAEAQAPAERVRATPKARRLAREAGVELMGIQGTGPRGMIVARDVPAPARPAAVPAPRATPAARKLAEEEGVDLRQIVGSGPAGRILREDVERVLEARAVPASPAPLEEEVELIPLTGLRAIIAERLSAAWRERPQVTLNIDVDATNLVSARQQLIEELGEKISFNTLLIKLVARALQEHPYMNARFTPAGIERVKSIHIGLAVDTERGLMVPVLHHVEQMNLLTIERQLRELVQRALEGRSLPDELTGGTFTITNLGMYGIRDFSAIINPPEAAILSVGAISPRPAVDAGGNIVARQMMTLSLSFDHRLTDGAPAARFLQRVKALVERPFVLTVLD
ncbi:MAG: 2-oxo acid dehydrogenase subunit E2 [Anaerolineae bacterium]|nr:2-oxo acid dehydrogenase subunit E2 [Anaerolineae bacterium]